MQRRARIGLAYLAGVGLGLVAAQQSGLFTARALPASAAPVPVADPDAAVRACAGGDGAACLRAANAKGHAHAGKRDAAAVTALLERGCGLADGAACGALATAVREGDGVVANPGRALELVTRACSLGAPASCRDLADAYTRGSGVAPDPDRALAAITRACDLGDAPACDRMGEDYAYGVRQAPDLPRGLALMTRACTLDSARCYSLAYAYVAGDLVPRDRKRGMELFVRACEAGDSASCNDVGVLLLQVPGLVQVGDSVLAPATVWFLRACNLASSTGCVNVGRTNPLLIVPRPAPVPAHPLP